MIALVDADVVAYRVAYGCNDDPEGVAIAKASEFLEDLVFTFANADDCEGYLTGKDNFRHEIAKTMPYKANRVAEKPRHLGIIREYMISAWAFSVQEKQEADDAISIRAYAMDEEDYIICSIDKDLNNCRGWHYDFNKNNRYYVTEEEAIKNFYTQVLTGDRVDNVPGLAGIGPKKAEKILDGCVTEQQLFTAVLEAYKGDIDRMTEMAQLLWLRRKENELWQPPKI
jgi:5'-3' exonuclease